MISDWEMVARLALAGAVGAVVGCEREARQRTAGIRTHAPVAVMATLVLLRAGRPLIERFTDPTSQLLLDRPTSARAA